MSLFARYSKEDWAEVDSNHRSKLQQIYSLSPLATRESAHIKQESVEHIIYVLELCLHTREDVNDMGDICEANDTEKT